MKSIYLLIKFKVITCSKIILAAVFFLMLSNASTNGQEKTIIFPY